MASSPFSRGYVHQAHTFLMDTGVSMSLFQSADKRKVFRGPESACALRRQQDSARQSLDRGRPQCYPSRMNDAGLKMRSGFGALLLILGCMGGVNDSVAATYADAVRDYDRGDFKAAAATLQPIAESGDPKAQVRLGLMYREGRGVGRDPATAFGWLLRAARAGRADAQYLVGTMYQRGEGTRRDNEAGRAWLRRAAAQGNPKAVAALKAVPGAAPEGLSDETPAMGQPPRSQPVDPAVAAETQAVLAAMDPPPSEAEVAAIRKAAAHGIRVVDGQVAAQRAKQQAAAEPEDSNWQPANAPTSLQEVMAYHPPVARGPVVESDESISRLPQRSVEKRPVVPQPSAQTPEALEARAAGGSIVAQRQLAAAYLRGSGVGRDPVRAAQWYRKAAVQGDAESQYVLSGMYFKGVGVPRDPSVAMQWLRRAAAQGHSRAQAQLTQSGN